MFPLVGLGTPTPYGTIGFARVGARIPLGSVHFLGHGVFGGGGGTTMLNGHDADLNSQVAGVGMQVGYARAIKSWTILPGIEAERLVFTKYQINSRPPYGGNSVDGDGAITILGAFVRNEYRWKQVPRLAAFLELALGYTLEDSQGFSTAGRTQMKTLAGVGYHAF